MKYFKLSNVYKNSTGSNEFNPKTIEAHSYKWWKYVGVVEGVVIFNNYYYSSSTSKHQNETLSLMEKLGIKIDLFLKLPKGINSDCLELLVIEAEETLCNEFLSNELKKQQRNAEARFKRKQKKLEEYLENSVYFRDYEIRPKDEFGVVTKIAVHQCVDNIERDVSNALHNFTRGGHSSIVFYV